jgi:hypothetical protein
MRAFSRRAMIAAAGVLAGITVANADTRLYSSPTATPFEERVVALVVARNEAIGESFGGLFENSNLDIGIEFAGPGHPSFPGYGNATYDSVRNVLVFGRRLPVGELGAVLPAWVHSYWRYYESLDLRTYVPLIEIVDDALWSAHMLEAAERRGLSWPHEGCASLDLALRLGCEMLVDGFQEMLRSRRNAMFNSNRVDRVWPEDLQELKGRARKRDDREYREMRRFGGALIIQPLVREFGASRVFAYVAQTPFRIEEDNVRTSAMRYQEQAREALAH